MEKHKKYALRKVSGIGLASCCVGVLLFLGGSPISADETLVTGSDTVISSSEVTDLKDETSSSTSNIQESALSTDNKTNDESVEDKNTDTELTATNESSDVGELEENKSEVTPEVVSDTVEGTTTTTADGTDRVANMKERTANTSSNTDKPFDLTGWEKITPDSVVTNEFDFNGIHYRMETSMHAPFVANKIINTETGKENTYSFSGGNAGTSKVKVSGVTETQSYDEYYKKISVDGITQVLGVKKCYDDFEVYELFTVGNDGAFLHEITLYNNSNEIKRFYNLKIDIDTQLNGNDRIPIIADGNGGVYITDNDITIWGQPIDGLKAYASSYDSYPTNNPAEGRRKGAEMSNGEDTAIVYWSGTLNFQPKESKIFSWRESLFTDGLNPITMGTVTTNYVDAKGGKLSESNTQMGTQGSEYTTQSKDIPNYTLSSQPSNANGVYTEGNIDVNYVYNKNQGTVTVNYLNEQNEKIADSTTTSGDFDADYHSQGKDIANYTLKTTPTNANGKYGTGNTTVNYVYAKKTGSVTVHYVGEDGNKLADDVVLSGTFDQDYQTQPKDIANYNLKTSPTNQTGKYGTTNQELKYVYSKKTAKVTVHYVGEDGSKLADDVVLSGTFDQDYQTQPKDIANYNLKTTPMNQTGKYGTTNQELKYVYSKKTAKVTVHYVGEDGSKLADDVVMSGTFDQDYKVSAKEVENYNLKTSPQKETGKYGIVNQEFSYVYSKKRASVTVRYVDESGKELAKPVTFEGTFDESWEAKPATLTYYFVSKKPVAEKGLFGIKNQTIDYVYGKRSSKVTIHYVNQEGEVLAEPTILSGVFDDSWNSEAKEIDNYEIWGVPEEQSGLFGIEDQDLTYTYMKKRAQVGIRYVNEDGVDIYPDETLEGNFDETWESHAKAIKNWELAKAPEKESGKYGTKYQIIEYVYKKKRGKVTVQFVDENGKPLADVQVFEGVFDDPYEFSSRDFEGYELVDSPKETKGFLETGERTFTFKYKKKASPQPEVKPMVQETPKQPELPKAGSQNVSGITSILGMMLASLGSLLFWKKRNTSK